MNKKELLNTLYKIESFFSAIESVVEKMSGYDAYPITTLCVGGENEIATLQNIIERIPDEKQ